MIFANLSFYQAYPFHLAQLRDYLYHIFFIRSVHNLPPVLWYKHDMVRAIPPSMLYTLIVHLDTSYVYCGCEPTISITWEVFFWDSTQRYGFA